MTPSPHLIGAHQTLARAHEVMRRHGIRHLPVLSDGKLTGVVSDRDLHLIETLSDVDPKKILVEEAMSRDVFVVSSEAPLDEVALTMAEKKYGCAVVMDREEVIGVFTVIDALVALARALGHQNVPPC
ncbi:MAG: CBS domain-containing protein [Deltaproteobacteria bacterium]|nr:CBS domain-containing protein [Deltaproteobacteria bacterium]